MNSDTSKDEAHEDSVHDRLVKAPVLWGAIAVASIVLFFVVTPRTPTTRTLVLTQGVIFAFGGFFAAFVTLKLKHLPRVSAMSWVVWSSVASFLVMLIRTGDPTHPGLYCLFNIALAGLLASMKADRAGVR